MNATAHFFLSGCSRSRSRFAAIAAMLFALGGCQSEQRDRPVVIDVIANDKITADFQHHPGSLTDTLLGATAQGLVAFNANGEVVAALAESWIVADSGRSYIFRLKRLNWADGKPVKSAVVAEALRKRIKATPNLFVGLEPEVRAMTDRVIEVRLDAPMPSFLQLLATPRLGIFQGSPSIGSGPYIAKERLSRAYLSPLADPLETVDDVPQEILPVDRRTIESARAALAIARFKARRADLVLGGRFQDLPLLAVADLPKNSVQADPVQGLFGLHFIGGEDFLADAQMRVAIAQSIDKNGLATALNLAGWTIAETALPAQLDLPQRPSMPPWSSIDLATRQANAKAAVERWVEGHGVAPPLRIALPEGSGSRLLFYRLARDLRAIGLQLVRSDDQHADIELIDEVAPIDSAFWYLGRIACKSGPGCDPLAVDRLAQGRVTLDMDERARLLSEAENLITAANSYVPLGMPIRWSLVDRRLTGFRPSPKGFHPLNQLISSPN